MSPDKAHTSNDIPPNNGVRTKAGPITLQSGAVYHGEWKNGMRDGEGTQ